MKLKILRLLVRKAANIHSPIRNTHTPNRFPMDNRRNQQPAIVFKRNESAVEQVVDRWRKQQPVMTIQTLVVGAAISPGFAMAGHQMHKPIHPRNTTSFLYLCDIPTELSLTSTSRNYRLPFSIRYVRSTLNLFSQMFFPVSNLLRNLPCVKGRQIGNL